MRFTGKVGAWASAATVCLTTGWASEAGQLELPASIATSWQRYPAASPVVQDWRCANVSTTRNWTVTSSEGDIRIELAPVTTGLQQPDVPFPVDASDIGGAGGVLQGTRYLVGESHVLRVRDGWLVGFNVGEFGGKLFWFNEDGSEFERVSEDRVVSLSVLDGRVLLFSSETTESAEGRVVEAYYTTSGWATRPFAALPTPPLLSESEGEDSILVLGRSGLFRLGRNGNVELLTELNLDGLYPSSFVQVESGEVYIGMRHFVVALVSSGGRWSTTWLIPSNCTHFGERCACIGDGDER